VPRHPLERRMRGLGFELRDSAGVVEIGETSVTPGGEVVLEHLIHDSGVLLVPWRAVHRDESRQHRCGGFRTDGDGAPAVRNGAGEDGRQWAPWLHPLTSRREVRPLPSRNGWMAARSMCARAARWIGCSSEGLSRSRSTRAAMSSGTLTGLGGTCMDPCRRPGHGSGR